MRARIHLGQWGFGRESGALHVFESIMALGAEIVLERSEEGDRLRVGVAYAAC